VAEKHIERFLSCEDYTGRSNLVISPRHPEAAESSAKAGDSQRRPVQVAGGVDVAGI
jgi:hypothetical protein